MRLAILVDIIAVAAGIAIILVTGDDSSGDAAEHRTGNCTSRRSNAR
jgi:hypothetical protein